MLKGPGGLRVFLLYSIQGGERARGAQWGQTLVAWKRTAWGIPKRQEAGWGEKWLSLGRLGSDSRPSACLPSSSSRHWYPAQSRLRLWPLSLIFSPLLRLAHLCQVLWVTDRKLICNHLAGWNFPCSARRHNPLSSRRQIRNRAVTPGRL